MKFLASILSLITVANAMRLGQYSEAAPPADANPANVMVEPEDETEGSIIEALMESCNEQVMALYGCYEDDEAALMDCTNCAWEGLSTKGNPCDDLDEQAEAGYAACREVCKSECDESVDMVYACGAPMFCGGHDSEAAHEDEDDEDDEEDDTDAGSPPAEPILKVA